MWNGTRRSPAALDGPAAGRSTSYTWATQEVSQLTHLCENRQRAGLTGHPPRETPLSTAVFPFEVPWVPVGVEQRITQQPTDVDVRG